MIEIESGITEATKLLVEYGLKDKADYECKKANCMVPYDMKKHNEIWIDILNEPYINMKRQLEARSKVRCEKLNAVCYPEYIFDKNKPVCSSCKDYVELVKPTLKKMDFISAVQKKLVEEWKYDEARK